MLEVTRDGALAVLSFNRPERRNALTLAMWLELEAHFRRFAEDASLRGVVVTGAGEHFCAGADISEFATNRSTAEQVRHYDEVVDRCEHAIAALPKPVFAAIRGFCMGGGTGLAVACDFRIGAPDAKFAIPAGRLGIVYGMEETRHLLATVGMANAKRILFGAERFGAEEGLRMGFFDEIADDPLARAKEIAGRMAENAPLSIAGAKRILQGLFDGTLDEEEAHRLAARAQASEDYAEGRTAFMEKRTPKFRGR
jgi:enoyl-CoA hydratase/carnithine racemase